MKKKPIILRVFLLLAVAITAGVWIGAGCGGSAAPSSSGSSPVAVEIPSLTSASSLPYTSGVVVAGSSSISAPINSAWSIVSKTIHTTASSNDFGVGDAIGACYWAIEARIALDASLRVDQSLCQLKGIASNISNLTDGNYHVFANNATFTDIPNKFKTKIEVDSNGIIKVYEMYACSGSTPTQVSYVSYTISGTSITASARDIRSSSAPQRQAFGLTGKLSASDPTQFTQKTVQFSYSGNRSDSGDFVGAINASTGLATLLLDAYDSVGAAPRVYGQATQNNPASFDPKNTTWGAGAVTYITSTTSSTTQCWDGDTNAPTTCSGANHIAIIDKTPMQPVTSTVASFGAAEIWDCSGTAEYTDTTTPAGFEDIAYKDSSTSCFSTFSIGNTWEDCVQATDGGFSVAASVSGTSLSTSSGTPTTVSTTPSIVLTPNRTPNSETFTSSTITLVNTANSSSVTLSGISSGWNSGTTALTVTATLTSGQTYLLTIKSGSTGVKSATGSTQTMSADKLYYMTAQ